MTRKQTLSSGILLFFFLALIISSMLPISADAAYFPIVQCGLKSQDNPATPQVEGACTTCDFLAMVKRIIDMIIYFLTPAIATAFFIYAGFLMLLSGANPGLYTQATKIFRETVYGVVVVLLAWVITNTFIITFGPNIAGFQKESWNSFVCPAGLP